MGQEIPGTRFKRQDFQRFERQLRRETDLLGGWLREDSLSQRHGVGGFELEAWLVDPAYRPAPVNEAFLAALDDTLVSPELSRFNFELNTHPYPIGGDALWRMYEDLRGTWQRCRHVAGQLGTAPVMIGILPTVGDRMLSLSNMSPLARYRALNEQVMRLRHGKPQILDIQGVEHLHAEHRDVMFEAATTSFQIHLQVAAPLAARCFNTLLLVSAPMVAVSANSPYLFGKRLWRETRIPLFEQAVSVGGFEAAVFGPVKRVTFGTGYARTSLMELFRENLEHYPILLPVALDEPEERLPHLRLHNGTIWRWNRPLVGFDDDGRPHLRLEHRVMPAGPTLLDSLANAAFFFGLVAALLEQEPPPDRHIDFVQARENFYAAAKHSLDARITWFGGRRGPIAELLQAELLPLARRGLELLACRSEDIDRFLGIMTERVTGRRNGAAWQIAYVERHRADCAELLAAYLVRQESGLPVHEWSV